MYSTTHQDVCEVCYQDISMARHSGVHHGFASVAMYSNHLPLFLDTNIFYDFLF